MSTFWWDFGSHFLTCRSVFWLLQRELNGWHFCCICIHWAMKALFKNLLRDTSLLVANPSEVTLDLDPIFHIKQAITRELFNLLKTSWASAMPWVCSLRCVISFDSSYTLRPRKEIFFLRTSQHCVTEGHAKILIFGGRWRLHVHSWTCLNCMILMDTHSRFPLAMESMCSCLLSFDPWDLTSRWRWRCRYMNRPSPRVSPYSTIFNNVQKKDKKKKRKAE